MLKQPELKSYPVPDHQRDQEKWIDLDGTGNFYLRLIYGETPNPITEVNFFYIQSKNDSYFVSPRL